MVSERRAEEIKVAPVDSRRRRAMDYEAIEIKNDGAVAWLTLNRPHNLNALSARMVAELEDYLHRLPTETATRVVVMKGAGRALCAGLDLKEQNRGRTGRRGS